MRILLINNNPVVSRLTALSARKEDIEIDEIQEVTELNNDNYDIVFVDGDSWSKDVKDVITDNIKVEKAVLFYSEGDEDEKESFDLTILKPFLPSEVSAVIRSVEEIQNTKEENEEVTKEEDTHFNALANNNVENREELFDLEPKEEKAVAELTETPSIETPKEEILFDSLEVEESPLSLEETKEENFEEKLDEAFPLKINTLDDDLFEEEKVELLDKKDTKNEEELFDLDLNVDDKELALDDELFSKEKETSSEKDSVLDFDLEEDEFKLDDEVAEKLVNSSDETKILDKSEIDNIKDILNEDTSSEMSLEDLMPVLPLAAVAAAVTTSKGSDNEDEAKSISTLKEESLPEVKVEALKSEDEEKTEEAKVEEETVETNSINAEANVLFDTIKSLPVEQLRELLAGAKIDISIRFPKATK